MYTLNSKPMAVAGLFLQTSSWNFLNLSEIVGENPFDLKNLAYQRDIYCDSTDFDRQRSDLSETEAGEGLHRYKILNFSHYSQHHVDDGSLAAPDQVKLSKI